jgi:twitching motility protein PilT
MSIVSQRELHRDVESFAAALRTILRSDPDVVLIGEMRDFETVEAALRIAETGHLTLGTLHTNSAYATIHRIVDLFPPHQQPQVRGQLALVLEGIISQRLLPHTAGGRRVVATEVLIPNAGIRNLIRDAKDHQVYSMMQAGQNQLRSHTMNQSLARLLQSGTVSYEVAVAASPDLSELRAILDLSGDRT